MRLVIMCLFLIVAKDRNQQVSDDQIFIVSNIVYSSVLFLLPHNMHTVYSELIPQARLLTRAPKCAHISTQLEGVPDNRLVVWHVFDI